MSFDRPIFEITSSQNPRIKEVVKLRGERHRKKQQKILIDGVRELRRAVKAGLDLLELYLCDPSSGAKPIDSESVLNAAKNIYSVPTKIFEKISYGNRNEGVVAVAAERSVTLDELKLSDSPLLLILDGIEKPGNVGAVFRTASAAGVDAILLSNEVSNPFNANAIRASLGTVFEIPFVSDAKPKIVDFLASKQIRVVTTRVDGAFDYCSYDFKNPVAIVMGSEADGVHEEWFDQDSITISMNRSVDSLNISATAAIVTFEAKRQRSSS